MKQSQFTIVIPMDDGCYYLTRQILRLFIWNPVKRNYIIK